MAKNGLLLCVCEGTCPSFQSMDVFEVLNQLRREKVFDWVALHPELCSDDGDVYLRELLQSSQLEHLYVAGCDPKMQAKLFRDAFEGVQFPREKLRAVDIRNMDTNQAVAAIKDLVAQKTPVGDDGRG